MRFTGHADVYRRHRPGYPPGAVDAVLEWIPSGRILDLGAGTGVLTNLLLERGRDVVAVEPNDDMRAAIPTHDALEVTKGVAERTDLRPASAAGAVAAQAFHWFDPVAVRAELHRVLVPPRPVVVIHNRRKQDLEGFVAEYEAFQHRWGRDYARVAATYALEPALREFFGSFETLAFENEQSLDGDGLVGRILSSSYMPSPGEPGAEQVEAAARDLFDRHQQGGRVVLHYDTLVHRGRLG
jgi:SAM-dependent methyltransferase